jgi:DNA-binding CsgD family transcriptional regulator
VALSIFLSVMSAQQTQRLTHPERQERREKIAAFVRDGHTTAEAAREFKVSIWMVRGACAEHGVDLTPRPPVAAAG